MKTANFCIFLIILLFDSYNSLCISPIVYPVNRPPEQIMHRRNQFIEKPIPIYGQVRFAFRSQMSIIPQDAFLFDDTVAMNLDPKQEHTSFEMMDVIEKCHLKKIVHDLGLGFFIKQLVAKIYFIQKHFPNSRCRFFA